MVAQAADAANILVVASSQPVRQQIAEQSAGVTQKQCLAETEYAAAGDYRDGEYQHRAGHQQPHDGEAFETGDDKQAKAKPLRVFS